MRIVHKLLLIALVVVATTVHAATGKLEVRAVDEEGQPLADVKVTVTDPGTNRALDQTTDEKGRVRFMGLSGGEVHVRFEKDDYQVLEKNARVRIGTIERVEGTLALLRKVLTEDEMTEEQLRAKRVAERYNLAVEQFRAGDLDGAEAGVAEVLELEPDLSEAFLLKARVLSKRKDHAGAADAYIRAIELNPDWDNYLPNLIAELQLSERQDEAAIYTARLEKIPMETPEDIFDLAVIKINAGEDRVALDLLERVLAESPTHAESYFERGLIRLRAGATVGALEDMQRYLELAPEGQHQAQAQGFVAALQK